MTLQPRFQVSGFSTYNSQCPFSINILFYLFKGATLLAYHFASGVLKVHVVHIAFTKKEMAFEPLVLFEGYSKLVGSQMIATCSCVLIKGSPNIIVDTMTSWDSERLQEAIERNNLKCSDINFVICTHGHSDHIGCNHLFRNAIHIVGFSISQKDRYFLEPDFSKGEEYVINERIRVVPTPGHTLQDVSVIVDTSKGIIAITGDLFEKEEDLKDEKIWISAGSDSTELQKKNREKILKFADLIIPGHGPMFRVPASYKD